MTERKLHGRTAIVFGAGSVGPGWGNGKAAAVAYARAGARVVAVDINQAAAEETAAIIAGEGNEAATFACDVTRTGEVEGAVAHALRTFQTIDILHNNVGVIRMGGVLDISEEDWLRFMDINLNAMFRTTKAVLPTMLKQKRGVITNISSIAAIRYLGFPYAAYYTSKGGINQLTVATALQYAREGIRCNAILPGLMDTPMVHQQVSDQYASPEEFKAKRDAATPPGRMGTAWDVAHAAVFLASDEAQYINAVMLPVDGGLTARCL